MSTPLTAAEHERLSWLERRLFTNRMTAQEFVEFEALHDRQMETEAPWLQALLPVFDQAAQEEER